VFRYRELAPSGPLRTFVKRFWILEDQGANSGAPPQRVVPDGRAELILNFGQPFEAFTHGAWHAQPRCFLAGQIDGPLLLRPSGRTKMLGIRFHPHGAAHLFGAPMHELNGTFTPIDDLSPRLARDLNRTMELADPHPAVEGALLASLTYRAGDLVVAEAVRRITNARGAANVAALARAFSLSTRQLERRFQTTVGLAPKLFARMQRFSAVFRVLEENPANWVDTALACGYYDQAHLIRDCKRFAGITPARLLDENGDLARYFYLRLGVSHSSNTAPSRSV
jgi:AraC-like DNA-binding protein